jgi:glycosyltransferase involved in cell wall biosynthesis
LGLLKTSAGAPWAVRQTRDLVELGVEVHVALPPGGPRLPEYEAAGVTVHPLEPDVPLRRPWHAPATLRAIRSLVDRLAPDIVHAYHAGTAVTMRLALGRHHPLPRVFQVPGPLHLEHAPSRLVEIATAGPGDYWIGTCRSIAGIYRHAGVAPGRLFVCDYGVDLGEHTPRPRGKLRRELGLDHRAKVVGMVALMYAPKRFLGQRRGLKGHEDLIDALALCRKVESDIVGVFVGGAWGRATAYEGRVRAYARERCGDRVTFLGTRRDVPDLLPDFDVAVQPSHSEGVAGTMVEAQLMGIPVVATNVGGQPDLIVDGETGWLVPPHDPVRLAEAILRTLDDSERARAMAARGRERAARLFDGKENACQVLEIYRTILAREAGAVRPRSAVLATGARRP